MFNNEPRNQISSYLTSKLQNIQDDQDVIEIVSILVENTTSTFSTFFQNPYAKKASELLLQACCFYLVNECRQEDHTLESIEKLLRCVIPKVYDLEESDEETILDILMDDLKKINPGHSAVLLYAAFNAATKGMFPRALIAHDCLLRLKSLEPTVASDPASKEA